MPHLKISSEFGVNPEFATLETSSKCSCSCTWCYVELLRRAPRGRRSRRGDVPDDFGRLAEDAFGPGYDPSDIRQFYIRNRYPVVWSAGTEPFQDVGQSRAILGLSRRLGLPYFVQTRGLNWREVWGDVRPSAGLFHFYISFPTDDDRVLRRFEPGTPPAAERRALALACREAGIPAVLAVAPYHPAWEPEGGLLAFASRAIGDWGVSHVFFDGLRLSPRQRAAATDPVMVELAANLRIADLVGPATDLHDLCLDRGVGFTMVESWAVQHGLYNLEGPDDHPYRGCPRWPYEDEIFLAEAQLAYWYTPGRGGEADDDGPAPDPLLITWGDALAIMEARHGRIGQTFAYGPIRDAVFRFRDKVFPADWRAALESGGTVADYLRALWNCPPARGGGFLWRHPFARVATDAAGVPWTDREGNVVVAFDPEYPDLRARTQVIGDPDGCRYLEPAGVP